jgi:uncharacterized RDD family membrane protein YckC
MSEYTPPPPPPPGGMPPPASGPSGGQTPGMSPWGPLAPWGERAVAYLIDYVLVIGAFAVVFIASMIVGAVVDILGLLLGLVAWVISIGAFLYIGFLNGSVGQTPGKKVMGIKVVSDKNGQVIGGGMGIVRTIAHFVDSLACYIGWFFPLWDAKRQTFADKIMTTVVTNGHPKVPFGDAVKSALPSK